MQYFVSTTSATMVIITTVAPEPQVERTEPPSPQTRGQCPLVLIQPHSQARHPVTLGPLLEFIYLLSNRVFMVADEAGNR